MPSPDSEIVPNGKDAEARNRGGDKPRWPLWIGIFVWLGMAATIALAYIQTFLV